MLIAWIIVTLVGLFVQFLFLYDDAQEAQLLQDMHWNGPMRLSLKARARNNVIRLITILIDLSFAALALTEKTWLAWWLPLGLILVRLLLLSNSLYERTISSRIARTLGHNVDEARRLIHKLKQQEEEE